MLFVVGALHRATVEEGGETVFPNADQRVHGPEWSSCAKQGLAVKPVSWRKCFKQKLEIIT